MEERVGSANDEHPDYLYPPPPPPDSADDTYIIQIPRDQIYRVPPPENAVIAQGYRKPVEQKSKGCRGRCKCICLCLIVTVALIVGIFLAKIYLFPSPKSPQFSIKKVLVKTPSSSSKNYSSPSYEISLKAENTNDKYKISYENGGGSKLSFKQHKIAEGKPPSFSQNENESNDVRVTLAGSKGTLPSEVAKSLNDTKAKTPVSLSLMINAPVKMKGLISTKDKDVTVTCDFKVNTLATGTKILSQECNSKL
ncbi:NDR1/HIN1-like protein 13 [Cornus florida]|uniref:NDR1/HIN1-like protein 13 n=1 Tax=Cornus florida TaxID=4283 RepID=UPI0028A26D93|nr:NDR1/HIN1-like protein 13 [Cornus florida]